MTFASRCRVRGNSIISKKPYWPPLAINGLTIDLAHLEPTTLSCPIPGRAGDLQINVRFSNHCFTEEFDPDRHETGLKIMDHKRPRAFSQRRYELSRNLPDMIAALPRAKVHQTQERRNYLYFTMLASLAGAEYQMFFTLKKAYGRRYDLELFVESAYLVDDGLARKLKRPHAIRFAILVLKTHRAELVRFAAR